LYAGATPQNFLAATASLAVLPATAALAQQNGKSGKDVKAEASPRRALLNNILAALGGL